MAKHKEKIIDTTPNCVAVKYPGLPRKIIVGTIKEMAIQQYREDFHLSFLRPDSMFETELVFEQLRKKN